MMNPVIERELIGVLRSGKAVAMQLVPAAACALLVLLRWPTSGQVDLGGSQSRQVFQLFGYGLLTAILLLVPAFPATSIVRERIRGTLALLLQTPLRPGSIYFGKLAGILGVALLPLAASAPAAAACYALGGLSARDEVLPLYGVLALAALQYAALGLLVSSRAASIDSALRVTYGLVLVLAVLTMAPYKVLQGTSAGPILMLATWLQDLSPLPAVMEILGHGGAGSQGLIAERGNSQRYAITALVTTALFAAGTLSRLRLGRLERTRPQGKITEERGRGVRWLRRLFFVVDPQRRARPIGRFTNPVLIKEFRTRRFGRSHWMLRLVATCAVASLALTFLSSAAALDWGITDVSALLVLLQGALIVLLIPSLAAGLISAEIESGGWAILQMTPLSPGRILRGKLLSVTLTMVLVLLATLPGYAVMVYAKPSLAQQVGYVVICLALTGLFALMLSAAIGSLFRRTAPATVASYAVLLGFCAGPLLFWLGRDTIFGHSLVERVLLVSPLAASLTVMEVRGFATYRLLPACWWLVGSATLACLIALRFRVWQLTRPR
jgi:ABC-type transport system involved in multi-copper enzyme maturation permease subunit